MNIRKTLVLGIALAVGIVRADRIVVTQDRESALYAAGEEARFSVSVVDDAGRPRKDGSARWTLDNFGTEKVADGQVSLAAGNPFTVTGTLAKPGFLRLKVDSGTNSAVWSVGYDVGAIRQDGTRPSDFDCYWRGEQQRLRREVPLDPTCERVEAQSYGRWDVFKVSFRTFNAKRVWGFMSVPKDRSKAPFRTRVRICDACAGAIGPWEANADEVTVTMNVFDYEPATTNEEQKRRYDAKNAELKAKYGTGRYSTSGIGESREDYYFHDAMLGIDRAIDWLAERPEVDRTRMYYFGSSQGGGFGLYVTYLNGNFSKACFAVPACTGHYGHLQGWQDGWPGLIAAQPEAKREAAEKFAAYFDGVHFAAGIHRPVRFLVGFADQTCPPPDVYAAFNACVSKDKAIVNCVGSGHCGFNDWVRTNEGKPSWLDYNAWLRDETKRLKVLMVGTGISQGFLRDLPSVAKACDVDVDPVSPARLDLAPIVQKSLAEGACVIEASLAATDAFLAFKAAHPDAPIVLDSSTVPSTPDGSSPAWNAIRAVRRFVDGKTVFWKSTADRSSYLYWTPDQGKEDKAAPVAAYPDGRFTLMENGEYYWRNRVRVQMERVKALRGKTVDLVLLGDSQTHFMEGRWGRLESPWPSVTAFTNGLVTLNLGIGGDRTEHALWRARNGQLDGYRAKAVSILIGSNDGGKRDSADDIVRGVSEIVKTVQAKQPDATIVLTALFPNRFTTGDPQETKRSEIRAGVRKLTDERKVLWLDVGDELRGPDGRIRKEYALDGVHLNDAGYGIWLGAMREKLGWRGTGTNDTES